MAWIALVLFVLVPPACGIGAILFGHRLLFDDIPAIDPALIKTRTDMFAIRAAATSTIVGLVILATWSFAIMAIGIATAIRLLWL